MKKISIVTPCYNEQDNIRELVQRVKIEMKKLKSYDYEHIIIDNQSIDATQNILFELAEHDSRIKIIINERNFGFSRSSFYGLMQSSGDATIFLMADLQDPPELIGAMIERWEKGAGIVACIKDSSSEAKMMFVIRTIYYKLMTAMTNGNHIPHFTGFGLYDKKFIELMKASQDTDPYLRGLVSQYGFRIEKLSYHQNKRLLGKSKFNLLGLIDLALLGLTTSSRAPLRLLIICGFVLSVLSFTIGLVYLVGKLMFWNSFQDGIAALSVGLFFLGSVQILFLGLIGEYVGSTIEQVRRRPLVIERNRINFEENQGHN